MLRKTLLLMPFLIGGKLYFNGGKGLFRPQLHQSQEDRTIIITGGSDGIGLETVKLLANSNAKNIIIASRNEKKAKKVIEEIQQTMTPSKLDFIQLDLGDLDSVEKFVKEFQFKYKTLDTLINNGGVYNLLKFEQTPQGFEKCFGVNYLGHFLLTMRLLKCFKESPDSRIINVSSLAHKRVPHDINFENADYYFTPEIKDKFPISNVNLYPVSKFCNILFTRKLQGMLSKKGSKIQVYSLHPGVIFSQMVIDAVGEVIPYFRYIYYPLMPFIWFFTKSTYHGALTTNFLAQSYPNELVGGAYYSDCRLAKPLEIVYDQRNQDLLWNKTIKILKELGHEVSL